MGHTRTCARAHTHTLSHTHTCAHTHTLSHTHTCVRMLTLTYTHTPPATHRLVRTHTHTPHTHTLSHTHLCAHTRTPHTHPLSHTQRAGLTAPGWLWLLVLRAAQHPPWLRRAGERRTGFGGRCAGLWPQRLLAHDCLPPSGPHSPNTLPVAFSLH